MIARSFRLFVVIGFFVGVGALALPEVRAAVNVPPVPTAHFNDYANYLPPDRARALDARLAQFERDTSNQLLVAIYPRLPAGAALEDYTVRAAQAWGVGRKKEDNGAVLFVFVADRALRIEVGYGLEGSLTDAVSHAIIENELKPNLRAGRPADALDAAVNAMIAATRGEYRGTGRTLAEQQQKNNGDTPGSGGGALFALFWFGLVFYAIMRQLQRSQIYGNPRPGTWRHQGPWHGGGGGWSGGSGGRSSGGGFSGGGGGFGGGGASGKW